MDTFAALALATDPPTRSILNRKPDPKSAPLITLTMWKMITGQAIFQLVVTLVLYFAGAKMLSYQRHDEKEALQTLIFNTFVWMQIFNQYNCRRLDNRLNIFEGVHRNIYFISIQFIIIGGQILIIFKGGAAFSIHPINGAQWGYSIVLGLLSLLVAVMIRLIPDDFIRSLIPRQFIRSLTPQWFVRKPAPQVFVSDEEHQYGWDQAIVDIRENLTFIKTIRGGRHTSFKYRLKHPKETLLPKSRNTSKPRINSQPQTPTGDRDTSDFAASTTSVTPESRRPGTKRSGRSRSSSALGATAAMAGVIASSVGGGWSPIDRREEGGSSRYSHSINRSELEDHEGVEVHPATKDDDPIITKDPSTTRIPPSQDSEITPAPPLEQSRK